MLCFSQGTLIWFMEHTFTIKNTVEVQMVGCYGTH